jgi:hypothetical protein
MFNRLQKIQITFILLGVSIAGCTKGRSSLATKSLSDFLGRGTKQQAEQTYVARQIREQKKLATCMKKSGFVYVVFVDTGLVQFSGPPLGVGQREWIKKNGYGQADDLMVSVTPKENPNSAIFSKLSPSEQTNYQTLEMKCRTQFEATIANVGVQLKRRLRDLDSLFNNDPTVVLIHRQWQACMKTKGYSVLNRQQALQNILYPVQHKLIEKRNSLSSSREEAQSGFSASEVASFRKIEMQLASADLECLAPVDELELDKIRERYEKDFLSQNDTLLTKYMDG